ncbi:SDR family NAD(P)-dependent oxidoreductase [Pseudomonas sp. Fl4BN1]|uniref:SDR family NAD(P)-dependent oxidoreductase n=1 Tax=Pseudomonas sp. Fl4BN1 TaxID=2697651 RepID=UPI001378B015|nr:SDR family NAD(P)-dependent oxidoreductase [Pseudomonas sp. Fl4BN1]NBF09178.1 SDR family NAD(P)-dependent oxidoreductase [Pseudomonas sp. Fl4BN1]
MSFDTHTRACDVAEAFDLRGQTYLITGGTSGLGKESARCLASRGARVVLLGSSSERGAMALEELQAATGSQSIHFEAVQFDSLRDVDRVAGTLRQQLSRIDGIIACAGIMATDFGLTEDGLERQFGINHIAHHRLITELLSLLRQAPGARVVMLTSGAHRLAGIDFTDPNFERRIYDRWTAYGQSKSANVLFAVGLDRLLAAEGIRALAVAPGVVAGTNLHNHLTDADFVPLLERQPGLRNLTRRKTTEEGAASILWALLHPELEGCGGYYLEDCRVALSNADPLDHLGVMPRVRDSDQAQQLWALSERIIKAALASRQQEQQV